MTGNKSLTRRNHKVAESMKRYLAAIDNNLYAAEQVCHIHMGDGTQCEGCNFFKETRMFSTMTIKSCKIPALREILGEHVVQDDPGQHAGKTPCVWAGGNTEASNICLFTGRKGCPEMIMVGNVRTCGRVHD